MRLPSPPAVRALAACIPAPLRSIRRRLMLETECWSLGAEERVCPACEGSGWLDADAWEHCPICCGFRDVPLALALWFKTALAQAQGVARPALGAHGFVPNDGAPAIPRERLGRLAGSAYRVHLSRAGVPRHVA